MLLAYSKVVILYIYSQKLKPPLLAIERFVMDAVDVSPYVVKMRPLLSVPEARGPDTPILAHSNSFHIQVTVHILSTSGTCIYEPNRFLYYRLPYPVRTLTTVISDYLGVLKSQFPGGSKKV